MGFALVLYVLFDSHCVNRLFCEISKIDLCILVLCVLINRRMCCDLIAWFKCCGIKHFDVRFGFYYSLIGCQILL